MRKENLNKKELAQLVNHAHKINALFNVAKMNLLHSEAIIENEQRRIATLTNKERNAEKRRSNSERTMSTFCKSLKTTSQAFRIDTALEQFHTMRELITLQELDDCSENRIKSHISFLKQNFMHVCRYVQETRDDKKVYFKFELI